MNKLYMSAAALVSLVVLATSSSVAMAKGGVDNPASVLIDESGNTVKIDQSGSNPLEVTVIGTVAPAVKIPDQGSAQCSIEINEFTCGIELFTADRYPEGTDMFVFQQLSVDMTEGKDADDRSTWRLLLRPSTDAPGVENFEHRGIATQIHHSENILRILNRSSDSVSVTLYTHKSSAFGPRAIFEIQKSTSGFSLPQQFDWSGYFTKR